ncbi:MAG: DsrE family protein [Candidatus Heimdallarchaeota archaeon]
MVVNFPMKYFLIFANSPEDKNYKNNLNAGLRLALTLLMDEYEVYLLLTEEAIYLARSKENLSKQETLDKYSSTKTAKESDETEETIVDDVSFSPYELLDGIASFGGHILVCKSSLTLTGLKEEDLIPSIELVHLQNAVTIMVECNQVLVF